MWSCGASKPSQYDVMKYLDIVCLGEIFGAEKISCSLLGGWILAYWPYTVRISFGCQIIEISGASSYNVQKLFIVSDNVSQAKIICRRCF